MAHHVVDMGRDSEVRLKFLHEAGWEVHHGVPLFKADFDSPDNMVRL